MNKNIKNILIAGLFGVMCADPSVTSTQSKFGNLKFWKRGSASGAAPTAQTPDPEATSITFKFEQEFKSAAQDVKNVATRAGNIMIAGVEVSAEHLENLAVAFTKEAEVALQEAEKLAYWTRVTISKEFQSGYAAAQARVGTLDQYIRHLESKLTLQNLSTEAKQLASSALAEAKRVHALAATDLQRYIAQIEAQARLLQYQADKTTLS